MIEIMGLDITIIALIIGIIGAMIALSAPQLYLKLYKRVYRLPMGDSFFLGVPDKGVGYFDQVDDVELHPTGDGYKVTLKTGIVLPFVCFDKNSPKCNAIQISTASSAMGKPLFICCVDAHGQEQGWAKDFEYIEGKVRDKIMKEIQPIIQKNLIENKEFSEIYGQSSVGNGSLFDQVDKE